MEIPAPIRELCRREGLALSLLVRAGSRSYGIDGPDSDDDCLGVFVAPLRHTISMHGLAHDTFAGNDPDFTLHEIGKFCRLALKGNPAILETLWNPDLVVADEWGRRLVALREKCLHHGSLAVYVDYADAQMRKMVGRKGLHAKGGTYNGKYGAHLVRLLHAGLVLVRTGQVMVRVPADLAALLRRIRALDLGMEEVLEIARPLLTELQAASASNPLPEAPDEAAFNELVIAARMAAS